jgi:aminoglycoside phosphotransferase (APT) family kinase protein
LLAEAKSFAGGERDDHHVPMGTAADEQAGSGTPSPAQQTGPPPPAAQGVRLPWEQVPQRLRQRIEHHLGSRVTLAVTQPGGFSPGAAARLELADGGRAFVKAVSPEQNPDSPGLYRAEAAITGRLPAEALAPKLLASFEDNEGWVALVFEDIDGWTPAQPWIPAELDRVLAALAQLAGALTPAPAGFGVPSIAEQLASEFRGWRLLAEAASDGDELDGLDPWAQANLAELAELESRWEQAAAGDSLVHTALRADNLLLTDDRVYVVDWPGACTAQPWIDLIFMLPSIRLQQGPPPETIWAAHPMAGQTDHGAVTAVVAALAGYFTWKSRQPAPKGIPTVRDFQRAQAEITVAWLRERIDSASEV